MKRSKYWNFNLTEEDHRKILTHQNGVCALCGHSLSEQGKPLRLAVDHNHADGLIRGLLCFRCNVMVGALTIALVEKILEYLLNPPATQALGAPRYGLPGRVGTKKQRKLYKKLLKSQKDMKAGSHEVPSP